jgi:hypothetical protein
MDGYAFTASGLMPLTIDLDNINGLCNYSMLQSLALVLVQIAFSTKNHIAFLHSPMRCRRTVSV